jgi:hypothetical protein
MKFSKISLGVAALCGIASAPAFALTASQYSAANAMNIYVSGATATDVGLELATSLICTSGSLHKYSISNQFVYLCTPNTAKITTAGKTQLAVFKHSVGGSGNGVAPVNNGSALPFLDLAKINSGCAAATAAGTSIACTEAGTTLTSTNVAQIGLSDVEPSFFGAAAATYNNLTSETLATVIFGVPVTNVAYEALQAAQSLTVGATDAANVPTLNIAQVTSMFTQDGQSWSGLTGAVLANDQVYVARRADSSGTQKSYEAVVARTANTTASGKSCYVANSPFVAGPDALDNTAANTLCDGSNNTVNNSGSGQVAACLVKHQSGLRGAIGTLSTETVGNANWKHVRVNGLFPNYANVKSGQYQYYTDSSLNTRKSPAPNAEHAAYKAALKANFAVTPILHPSFGNTATDAGKAGTMTLDVVTGSTGGNPWSRLAEDGVVDNCRAPRGVF